MDKKNIAKMRMVEEVMGAILQTCCEECGTGGGKCDGCGGTGRPSNSSVADVAKKAIELEFKHPIWDEILKSAHWVVRE